MADNTLQNTTGAPDNVNAAAQQEPAQPQAQQSAQQPAQQNAGAKAPTFDEMLKSGYQAEFDRRVQKAIQTAQGKFTDPQVAALKAQLDGYIRREQALRAGIAPDFVDFVAYEVGKTLPEGGSFEDGLKAYLEAHAQYKAGAQTAAPAAWSQQMQMQDGGAQTDDGVTAAFKAMNPGLKI